MPTSGLKLVGLNSLYNAFNVYIHVHVDMLASYSGKAHNYQKLAVCTACTLTSIPRTNMCMKIWFLGFLSHCAYQLYSFR